MHTIQRPGVGERILMPLQDNEGQNRFIIGATMYTAGIDATEAQLSTTPSKTFTPFASLFDGESAEI
jgi:hypothetical protein